MANPIQERLAQVLLERIRNDRHPSTTQMSMLESNASPEVLVDYVQHLLERIEEEPYPSIDMMRRVEGIAARFGA